MLETRDKSLPVVDERNRFVGIISRSNIVRSLKGRSLNQELLGRPGATGSPSRQTAKKFA